MGKTLAANWRALPLPAVLLVGWALATHNQSGVEPRLLVSPLEFSRALLDGVRDLSLPLALAATLTRTLFGLLCGTVLGLSVGLLVGLARRPKLMLSPTLDGLRQVALFAWIPLLSAWLGNGEAMKLSLITLGAFFPVALATAAGCANVARPYLEVGRVLKLNAHAQVTSIILPAAAPEIAAGIELAVNVAWLGTIGAEYLIGTGYINGMGDGVGAYLAAAREYARMDQVLVGVLALALVGLSLDRAVAYASRRILPWHSR